MTDDMSPNKPPTECASIASGNQLSATNSQIGNAAQIIGSPGAVVNQVHTEQSSAVAGTLAGMFGVLLLLLVGVLPLLGKLVPGWLAALLVGISSASIVGGFFLWVEGLLKTETKKELAVWLLDIKTAETVAPWPVLFNSLFNHVFGPRHWSWLCFVRSCLFSAIAMGLSLLVWIVHNGGWGILHMSTGEVFEAVEWWGVLWSIGVIPDYCTNGVTRCAIGLMKRYPATGSWLMILSLATLVVALVGGGVTRLAFELFVKEINYDMTGLIVLSQILLPLLFALFLAPIWLWLYASSGFLLKAAIRFDLGSQWFNRIFPVETNPLSAIGLVAGVLVAMVYWGVAVGVRVLGE